MTKFEKTKITIFIKSLNHFLVQWMQQTNLNQKKCDTIRKPLKFHNLLTFESEVHPVLVNTVANIRQEKEIELCMTKHIRSVNFIPKSFKNQT